MSGRYYEESRLYSAVQRWNDVFRPVGQVYRSSGLKRISDRLKRSLDSLASITRQSRLVRWLTAEPDPDVIVIDLRETWTVGPIITVLDRLVPHGLRMWNGSKSRNALERATNAFRNAPVQLTSAFVLVALLVNLALSWGSTGGVSLGVRLLVAGLALVGLRITWTLKELAESKVGRLATTLLAPPEPPEDEN